VREDALMGRLYLPLEDFERFGCSAESLKGGIVDGGLRQLMAFEAGAPRNTTNAPTT